MSTMSDTKRKRTRRSFTDEFKAGAVRLVLEEGKTVGAAARDLDLTESSLRKWVEQVRADRTKGKTGLTTAEREELAAAAQRESRAARGAGHPKKSDGLLREAKPVRFRFVAAEKAHHAVPILCRCVDVTRSGFYAYAPTRSTQLTCPRNRIRSKPRINTDKHG